MYNLIILEEADKEFQEAAVWYEGQSQGLGVRFIETIKLKLEIIREHLRETQGGKAIFANLSLRFSYSLSFILFTKKKER